MKKMKIENQKEYLKAISNFEDKYISDFNVAKDDAVNLELFYTNIFNSYNGRMNTLQNNYPINAVKFFIQEWIFNNNSKSNFKSEFEIIELFCKKNKCDFEKLALAMAELAAIQKVFKRVIQEKEKQFELNEGTTEKIENEENIFCKSMPLEVPIKHFKVLTERKSKNGKPFLSTDQFNSFIDKAFKGKQNLKKERFNLANREKLFIVKRFYQFYLLATNTEQGYENTLQSKPKYIKLLSDNFTNWNYESLKHNFGNKVKPEW